MVIGRRDALIVIRKGIEVMNALNLKNLGQVVSNASLMIINHLTVLIKTRADKKMDFRRKMISKIPLMDGVNLIITEMYGVQIQIITKKIMDGVLQIKLMDGDKKVKKLILINSKFLLRH